MKKLYRSKTNRIVGGILGGVGEYLNVDPVIVRLIFVILFIFTKGLAFTIMYALAYLIIPEAPDGEMIRDAEIVDEKK